MNVPVELRRPALGSPDDCRATSVEWFLYLDDPCCTADRSALRMRGAARRALRALRRKLQTARNVRDAVGLANAELKEICLGLRRELADVRNECRRLNESLSAAEGQLANVRIERGNLEEANRNLRARLRGEP